MVGCVSRSVGFGREFEFVAEVTTATADGGVVTVREEGATEWGAMEAARMAAARRMHARRRRTGFYAGGFVWRTGSMKAGFAFGFGAA